MTTTYTHIAEASRMKNFDYSDCISRHTRWGSCGGIMSQAQFNLSLLFIDTPYKIETVEGLKTIQFRISLTGTETERQIKQLLTQKSRYSIACNSDNIRVYREKRDIVIEMPSDAKNDIRLGDVYCEDFRNMTGLPLIIGMDSMKNKIFYDLAKAPHMLVAGTTGSGKSIFIHSVIDSLIMHDATTDIFMIDPKMTEYNIYNALSHFHLVKDVEAAIDLLDFVCNVEMEERYKAFDKASVRDFDEAVKKGIDVRRMVVIVDEFADLILTSHRKVEEYVVRLAQKARACGIHLVLATQRPTAEVITGLIKSNIPTRVCMKVNSSLDSRIILDRNGGETITEKGEMLFLRNGDFEPIRVYGCFMTEEDRESIVSHTINCDNTLMDIEYFQNWKKKQTA